LRLGRAASQLWVGTRYERPGETMTAATGTTILAAEAVLLYVL